jgi:hypothetical protein
MGLKNTYVEHKKYIHYCRNDNMRYPEEFIYEGTKNIGLDGDDYIYHVFLDPITFEESMILADHHDHPEIRDMSFDTKSIIEEIMAKKREELCEVISTPSSRRAVGRLKKDKLDDMHYHLVECAYWEEGDEED